MFAYHHAILEKFICPSTYLKLWTLNIKAKVIDFWISNSLQNGIKRKTLNLDLSFEHPITKILNLTKGMKGND